MAKRPTSVKIGNHDYAVSFGPIESDTSMFLYGRTSPRLTKIEINTDYVTASQQRDTLVHEILHAILGDVPHGLSDNKEERIVRCIAPMLLGVLRDNPDLVRFLREGATSG